MLLQLSARVLPAPRSPPAVEPCLPPQQVRFEICGRCVGLSSLPHVGFVGRCVGLSSLPHVGFVGRCVGLSSLPHVGFVGRCVGLSSLPHVGFVGRCVGLSSLPASRRGCGVQLGGQTVRAVGSAGYLASGLKAEWLSLCLCGSSATHFPVGAVASR